MKANEFIKKHGWEEVKRIVTTYVNSTHVADDARAFINDVEYKNQCPWFADSLNSMVTMDDLKRYIDAYELMQSFGGLVEAKRNLESIDFRIAVKTWFGQALLNQKFYRSKLNQAIQLVEECQ